MKKIILAMAISSLLFINSACSSDDSTPTPPPPTYSELLVGKWQITEAGEIVDGKKIAKHISECEAKGWLEYTTDAKYIAVDFEIHPTGECKLHSRTSTYSIEGSIVTHYYVDPKFPTKTDTDSHTITLLNATELHIKNDSDGTIYYANCKKI